MIRRNILIKIVLLLFIKLDLFGSTQNHPERVFVHPILWSGPSYYKRDKYEDVIRQVFINSGKYEYLGGKEYYNLLKQYPDYLSCTKLYCIYEIAHRLDADYVAVLRINEMFSHYNVCINIYDTDSMKVRYLKNFVIHENDPTITDSLKVAFYKWNGKKYRPKTEIYDKIYEQLWTKWNLFLYNCDKYLNTTPPTSKSVNQEIIPQNVVNQIEPKTVNEVQNSIYPITNKSEPKIEETVTTSSFTSLYINAGFIEPWGDPGTGTLFKNGKRIQAGTQLNICNVINLPSIFKPLTAEVMVGYGMFNIKDEINNGNYQNAKTSVISVSCLGRYDIIDLILQLIGYEYSELGLFGVVGFQYNRQFWDFPNWVREFDSASSFGLNMGLGVIYNLQSLVDKPVEVDLRFTQGTFIMGDVPDQNGDYFFHDSNYKHIENSLLLGIYYLF